MAGLSGLAGLNGPSGIFGQQYYEKVLTYHPIAYWPLNESTGTVAYELVHGGSWNGTYSRDVSTMGTGAGIGDGYTAPLFDGANDSVNVYSAAFASAFNGAEGTFIFWIKARAASVWSDSVLRELLRLQVDGSNLLSLRSTGSNTIQWLYFAGGTTEGVAEGSVSETDWTCLATTWSAAADETELFRDGVSKGTSGSLGVWAGTPGTITLCSEAGVVSFWDGYGADGIFFDRALTQPELVDLAVAR